MKRVKTGFLERRLELTKAGVISAGNYAARSALNMLLPPEEREARNRALLAQQAEYFVREIGKLKGSVVKIGQMMALYGEYFLPKEIKGALHKLEDSTEPLEWPSVHAALEAELGATRLAQLEVDEQPLAAASLSQAHRAYRRSDGQELCLKIQYPGIAQSIDTDFNAIVQLLNLSRILGNKTGVDIWLREIRHMLHLEVDYRHEAHQTQLMGELLSDDARFVVPRVIEEFSGTTVLALSWEPGLSINDSKVQALPQPRRDALGEAMLDLFLSEVFDWGKMQTDPNFGNYLIRPGTEGAQDQLVLLDFGAVKSFDRAFMQPFKAMVKAAYDEDPAAYLDYAMRLGFMQEGFPEQILQDFAEISMAVIEPLAKHPERLPPEVLNASGAYHWKNSRLPRRIAKQASKASLSRYFALPPQEFMFINRKLLGVYTFIMMLDGQFNGGELLQRRFS